MKLRVQRSVGYDVKHYSTPGSKFMKLRVPQTVKVHELVGYRRRKGADDCRVPETDRYMRLKGI